MNSKVIIGLALIIAFLALGLVSFMGSQVSSVTIENARRSVNVVQVEGAVDFATMNYDVNKHELQFDLINHAEDVVEGMEPHRLHVVYHGEVPGNFEQATSVTVVGKTDGDQFVAQKMLVKCPSKYQGEPEQREYEAEPLAKAPA